MKIFLLDADVSFGLDMKIFFVAFVTGIFL